MFLALLISSLVLLSLGLKEKKGSFPAFDAFLVTTVTQGQKSLATAGRSFFDVGKSIAQLLTLRDENARLRQELSTLKQENLYLNERLAAQERLERLLELKESFQPVTAGARVVARDPTGWFKAAWIDKGSQEGLRKDFAVIVPEGLVGRIVEVFPHRAKILLVIDPNSAVDGLASRSRDQGIIYGRGNEDMVLRYLPHSASIQPGDLIVSSGLEGIYPKGVPVGKVSKIRERRVGLYLEAEVSPTVDFSRLEEVLVVIPQGATWGEVLD